MPRRPSGQVDIGLEVEARMRARRRSARTPRWNRAPDVLSAGSAAVLATLSSVFGVAALLTSPSNDPSRIAIGSGDATVLSEPYVNLSAVTKAYGNEVPVAVDLAVKEFDTDARADVDEGTQDFQTKYSPDFVCADEKARPLVLSVYGANGCESGSPFYTTSERYDRYLLIAAARGDPRIGTNISLSGDELRRAFAVMRDAQSALIGCLVKNNDPKVAVNITITPSAGFVVEDKPDFVLDPGDERKVILKPAPDVEPPIG